ncbi:hypothetical protein GGX14DRAFT_652171 [Mycena pura]|uniref:Uncharacterized protein n=1 Tax=Mycena pura TaxID=153505 RepID=A0AAD6V9M1_9AGAR|nr:hypothetical protein GGX14DRAFT_652171 [Mycena pura]
MGMTGTNAGDHAVMAAFCQTNNGRRSIPISGSVAAFTHDADAMSLLAGLAGLRGDANLHDLSFAQLSTFTPLLSLLKNDILLCQPHNISTDTPPSFLPPTYHRPHLTPSRVRPLHARATDRAERSSSWEPYRPAPLRSGSTPGSASRTRPQTRSPPPRSASISASASYSRSGSRSHSRSPGPRTPVDGLPPLLELGLVAVGLGLVAVGLVPWMGKGFAGREDGRAL